MAEIDCFSGKFSIRIVKVTALLGYLTSNGDLGPCCITFSIPFSNITLERWFEDGS